MPKSIFSARAKKLIKNVRSYQARREKEKLEQLRLEEAFEERKLKRLQEKVQKQKVIEDKKKHIAELKAKETEAKKQLGNMGFRGEVKRFLAERKEKSEAKSKEEPKKREPFKLKELFQV